MCGDTDISQAVMQNLRDAGCGRETVEQFREFCRSGELQKQFVLLETHRKCLLGKIHKYEKQIECLDYLVFQMKRAADGTRTRGE